VAADSDRASLTEDLLIIDQSLVEKIEEIEIMQMHFPH
jgi:hypothetical protein